MTRKSRTEKAVTSAAKIRVAFKRFFAFLVLWNKEQLIMMAVMSLSLPLILVAAEIFEIRASLD